MNWNKVIATLKEKHSFERRFQDGSRLIETQMVTYEGIAEALEAGLENKNE